MQQNIHSEHAISAAKGAQTTGTRLEISETIALLGFLDNTHTTQEQKLINQLILMAKMCISKCRYANGSNADIIFDKELAL